MEMEISKRQLGEILELRVKGRLDNHWAEFFAAALASAIQDGAHHLRLELSEVTFLSSAGIGVLVRFYQQLQAIQGTFAIVEASSRVRSVLKLVALEPVLFGAPAVAAAAPDLVAAQCLDGEKGRFEVFELDPKSAMRCLTVGDPGGIASGQYGPAHCYRRELGQNTIALGLGAFGANFEECRGRFGEFMSVAGCSAHLPTDGTDVPDFLISAQGFAPEVQVLYGLEFHGVPSLLIRFDTRPDSHISLSQLAIQCLQLSGATALAFAVVAETTAVVGAALRASPDGDAVQRFAFPQVREWVAFSPGTSGRSTAVIAGVCGYDSAPQLAAFVRPMDSERRLAGHFHGAIFPYRPVQRGRIALAGTARDVFQTHAITSVLHLLNDSRAGNGMGESEFLRGACWVAPIADPEVVR